MKCDEKLYIINVEIFVAQIKNKPLILRDKTTKIM